MKNVKLALFFVLVFFLVSIPCYAAPPADMGRVVQEYRLVDLTITLDENTPVSLPTHVPFQRKIFNYYEHTGTHFDAPNHFIPPAGSGFEHEAEVGKITGDKVDLNRLMGGDGRQRDKPLDPALPHQGVGR